MKFKINNSVSIADNSNQDFLKYAYSKGTIGVSNSAPTITSPNINLTFGALQYIRPRAIEVLTAPRTCDKIASSEKFGVWGDRTIVIKQKEFAGKTSPDDGLSESPSVKTNYNYITRGVYYYQTSWMSTDLEETTATGMQENYRADQVNSAMQTLAIDRNNFFFRGVKESSLSAPVYGFLNEPQLPAYKTVKQGSKGKTEWDTKTPEEIHNDIVDAVNELYKKSNGVIEDNLANGKIKMAIASNSLGNIDRANSFGLTARIKLRETFGDNLEIIAVPQLNLADSSSDCFYLMFDMQGADSTILNGFVEMARAYPIFQKDSVVSQKISGASAGCIIQYPWAIVRFNGIGK
nr:MAG TPA: major capsid protein [Caudoviricetes sp.]